ncbi:neuropeptide SIFamide receptor-like [Oppia nitens]|uniref:neuropeptide SIFamide receptor-like n=1 Tax=Oppia nitens TaxID=1686743 RepID=UPI0023DAD0FA|nr:neuropeptide SIFamide receptor-like [Oppia nitens]
MDILNTITSESNITIYKDTETINKSYVNQTLNIINFPQDIKSVEFRLNCDSDDYCFMRYSAGWTVALCIAYLLVFIIGLVGNLSVLWIILTFRRTYDLSVFNSCNKVFNGLISNLAFADLLVVIFCLPPTLIGNIFSPWILGRFVCKAVPYLQGVSVTASVYTLVAISADR